MSTPAGWYPDPGQPGQLRYWDGQAWTKHLTPMPPPPGAVDNAVPQARVEDSIPGTRSGEGFVVIDVETTGLSRKQDRILELAIVTTDPKGQVLDEWVSRFNPQGRVGPTHIHGITEADVRDAPLFTDSLPDVNRLLMGHAIAAHNANFDLAFLRAEYARAGWTLPAVPSLCTLQASRVYLPSLRRRRLPDCCLACGIKLRGAHSALGDAKATAALLAEFLDPAVGVAPRAEHLLLPIEAANVVWPSQPSGPAVETAPRQGLGKSPPRPSNDLAELLGSFNLWEALDEGAPEGSFAYLELLITTLEDGELSDDEVDALIDIASVYSFNNDDIFAANRGFLLALCHHAVDHRRVRRSELLGIAALLGLPQSLVSEYLRLADDSRYS